jgi:hypothetical protein
MAHRQGILGTSGGIQVEHIQFQVYKVEGMEEHTRVGD